MFALPRRKPIRLCTMLAETDRKNAPKNFLKGRGEIFFIKKFPHKKRNARAPIWRAGINIFNCFYSASAIRSETSGTVTSVKVRVPRISATSSPSAEAFNPKSYPPSLFS